MDAHSHPILAIAGLFVLGVLHGVGPDHLAALGTLASRRGSVKHAVAIAIRFGLGHAGFLAVGAVATFVLGLVIPEAFERAAELFGGSVVAILGAAALLEAMGLRVHSHPHGNDGDHAHKHVHVGRGHHHEQHRHGHGAAMVGALLAVSGLRGLLLLLPAAVSGSRLLLGGAVVAFGAGVVVSMVAAALLGAGAAYAGGKAGLHVSGRVLRGLVGAASFSVGVAWCIAAW